MHVVVGSSGLSAGNYAELDRLARDWGMGVVAAGNFSIMAAILKPAAAHAVHPTDPRLNGSYGTIWFDELGDAEGQVHQRNVAVFADGEVDRSPWGQAPAPGSRRLRTSRRRA